MRVNLSQAEFYLGSEVIQDVWRWAGREQPLYVRDAFLIKHLE